jgi:Fe-Mn family superoxide dismutase
MAFTLPDLPYSKDAFGDYLSAETFDYHHGKHHQAYVTKANELIAADPALQGKSLVELIRSSSGTLFNQVGQIWNHSFYWQCLSPQPTQPSGNLQTMIDEAFGSLEIGRASCRERVS